jgi:dihydropyrimidine dehydrogenase (NAD+) subunit PreA
VNLQEIKEVKRAFPDRAMVVSLMVPCEEANWKAILPLVEETGADGIELNFGCPHGMSERGMGSAVGQVPEYIEMVARWCKQHTRMPVIVKLTPNITDIRYPARAAMRGGADAVSLINTISSITSVNLDTFSPEPSIDGKGSHGGYCGPAVKPIALNMVAEIARDRETRGMPISGIGGITTWRDAAEFMALGSGTVQVCTAAMAYGFKIVREMIFGLESWMDEKGYTSTADFIGMAAPNVTDWQYLNLNYVTKALIHQDLCIKCGRCHIACEDTSHQAITNYVDGKRHFEVIDAECVGCNLCVEVCPVENCITMEPMPAGSVDPRTGRWSTRPTPTGRPTRTTPWPRQRSSSNSPPSRWCANRPSEALVRCLAGKHIRRVATQRPDHERSAPRRLQDDNRGVSRLHGRPAGLGEVGTYRRGGDHAGHADETPPADRGEPHFSSGRDPAGDGRRVGGVRRHRHAGGYR